MKSRYFLPAILLGVTSLAIAQKTAAQQTVPRKPDMASAYYHYALAHMYEEQMAVYGRSDLANKAIEEYRAAIDADPSSEYLTAALAELYAKTGRIRDAVLEAQDILKKDPNNLEAHKLLGRIYLQSLGDMQPGSSSASVLKLAIEQYEQIVKITPDSMDDHLLLGRLYQAANDFGKAETEFKAAMKLDPDSEEAVIALALLYSNEGDGNRATQVLSSFPAADRSAKVYSALGATYGQQRDYKKAIEAYRHAISMDRDNLDAIRGLAQNLLSDGQDDAALDQYKIIVDANPEDAQTYLDIADIYRKQGKYDLALDNLQKAGSIVPDLVQVPYQIATIYQLQGRYDDAAQVYKDLLKKTEKADGSYTQEETTNRMVFSERLSSVYEAQGRYDDAIQILQDLLKQTEKPDKDYTADDKSNRAGFLERLGTIYRDDNNDDLAIAAFRRMLTLGDDSAERGYSEIIDTYREEKDWQKATDAAKEATDKLPNNRRLKMVYASQLADMGQPEVGLAEVKALLKGTPDDREVYISLSQMYSRLKRWPEAEQALDQAEKFSTKDEDKQYVYFLRGSVYERQKKYDQAEAMFEKILAENPDSGMAAMTLNYLGYMLADQGTKLDEALGYIKKAVQLDPANGAYLDSLGWTYFRLGKYDLAEENLVKASQLQNMGSDPTVQEHLGDLYQKTGRLRLAAAHWERALHEWNRTVAAEVDTDDVAKVQKKLESAKVKLAREDPDQK